MSASDTPRTDALLARWEGLAEGETEDFVENVLFDEMKATELLAEGLAGAITEALGSGDHTNECGLSNETAGTVGQCFCHVGVLREALSVWTNRKER